MSTSWKRLDAPVERENLEIVAGFSDADGEQMIRGFVPKEMEDKWLIDYDAGWLYFRRSWTGAVIYGIRLDGSPLGVRVIESWANRNPEQYRWKSAEYDRRLVLYLIDRILLKKDVPFPSPPDLGNVPDDLVRHHLVGRQ